MHLSPKQLEVVQHSVYPQFMCLAGGATRSGKSLGSVYGFGSYVIERLDREHALIGFTLESIMRNVGWELIKYFKSMGYGAKLSHLMGTKIEVYHGNSETCFIYLVGANDERARNRLQGATLSGAFVDESVTVPESLWQMLLTRLTPADAKLWCTFNPDTPQHWFKREVVDRVDSLDATLHHFHFDDNPSLSEEYKERIRSGLRGHWYQRLVDGIWAGGAGLIYKDWKTELHKLPKSYPIFALDWGVAGVFAAIRCDVFRETGNIVDEYRYDARVELPRTDSEQAMAFQKWAGNRSAKVIVDPNTSNAFKNILRRMGYWVIHGKNDMDNGLRHTSEKLANGDVRIGSNCRELIKELNSYSWDFDMLDKKDVDYPLKSDDHLCDAMRYLVHTIFKDRVGIGTYIGEQAHA